MIQPAPCSHAVITVNEGPALVVGFEGKLDADINRRSQVLQQGWGVSGELYCCKIILTRRPCLS